VAWFVGGRPAVGEGVGCLCMHFSCAASPFINLLKILNSSAKIADDTTVPNGRIQMVEVATVGVLSMLVSEVALQSFASKLIAAPAEIILK
jgi:hypothetical protein